jgi:FMN phosphatase YigB (HAD superfamily)
MMYFLDFDRTLFDTDTFNRSLPDEPGCAAFADDLRAVVSVARDETLTGGDARIAAWDKLQKAVKEGALSFSPGYLARFLYADVAECMRGLGNEAVVITYGGIEWQKAKVESALADIVRVTALYTDAATKADYLASWPGYYGQEAFFVDDRVAELELLALRFPQLKLYEIRRDGKEGDGRWPVIRSLSELP